MRLITPSESAHWYTAAGEPKYDATLREARKFGYLPSVSGICRLWPKGALESWKQEQLILAALTLPRNPGESLDAFAHRVAADGQSTAKTTAQWGTRFHDLCEKLHRYEQPKPPPEMTEHYRLYREWFIGTATGVVRTEHCVVNPELGYAGKLDLLMLCNWGRALGDIKSRSVKNGKPTYYDEQAMQLAAYGMALPPEEQPEAYFSVIVNRDTPEPPYVKWWTPDEILKATVDFMACLNLWTRVNKYTPGKEAVAA